MMRFLNLETCSEITYIELFDKEVCLPLYMLGFLVLLRTVFPNPNLLRVEPQGHINLFKEFKEISSRTNLTIAIAPNSSHVQSFMSDVNETLSTKSNDSRLLFYYFNSEKEMIKSYWGNPNMFTFGLIFSDDNPYVTLRYNILTNPSWVRFPDRDKLYASQTTCRKLDYIDIGTGKCPAAIYHKSGFVALQVLLDYTKIRVTLRDKSIHLPNITLSILPKESYIADWLVGFRVAIPIYIVFGISQCISYLLVMIVHEKETKIKVILKVMGLRDSVYWLSWFLLYGAFSLVMSLISVLILCYLHVFENSSFILMFLLTFLYSLSVILISFMISPFFNSAKVAGVVGSFAVNLLSLLYFVRVFVSKSHSALLWIISLISSAAFSLALDKALMLDLSGEGLSLGSFWSGTGFTFGDSLLMLVVDIVLYGSLTLYLDSVWPSQYGTKKHPLFFFHFLKSFLAHKKEPAQDSDKPIDLDKNIKPHKDVEEISEDLKSNEAIRIVGLCKSYSSWGKPTVNVLEGVDLVIYENEITAVLGQNGAGKSTLFNLLTGLSPPTAGTAYIYNRDIRDSNDINEVQRLVGVCPQSNILVGCLTPAEHLLFFGRIKGIDPTHLPALVKSLLQDLELAAEADSPSAVLSGGQKRKLSIGIALIGDPKILILDEPIAGVDVHSKRQILSLLQSIKSNKVILISTHLMEEADTIADRKAIICNGRIRCCGTSLFLKNRFGMGFRLLLDLDDMAPHDVIKRIIKSYVPNAKLTNTFGKEMNFILPNESLDQFAPLLFFIEKEIKSPEKKLKILSYGVSMSSLEQVYLQLTSDHSETLKNEATEKENTLESTGKKDSNDEVAKESKELEKCFMEIDVEYKPNLMQMTQALLRLRCLQMIRDWQKLLLIFVFSTMLSTIGFQMRLDKQDHVTTSFLNQSVYPNDSGIAVYDDCDARKQQWLTKLTSETRNITYNGTYGPLIDLKPLLGALQCRSGYVRIMYNDTMQHSLPIMINLLNNAVYSEKVRNWTGGPAPALTFNTRSLPLTFQLPDLTVEKVSAAILLGMTFLLMPLSLAYEIIHDRQNKSKHLLLIAGMSRSVYYGIYAITFGLTVFLVSLLNLLISYTVGTASPNDINTFFVTALLLLPYCPAVILFITCISFIFNKSYTAHSFLPSIIPFLGIISLVFVAVSSMLGVGGAVNAFMSLTNIVYVPYAVFYFLQDVHAKCDESGACAKPSLGDHCTSDLATVFVCTLLQIPILLFVAVLLDLRTSGYSLGESINFLFNKTTKEIFEEEGDNEEGLISEQHNLNEDDDVKREKERVKQLMNDKKEASCVVVAENLRNEYKVKRDLKLTEWSGCCSSKQPKKVAVEQLSFSVGTSEVFGLLGHNGAGKTTSMKIISGEIKPTKGRVWVLNRDEGGVGYCPQRNALWSTITVKEHLEIHAAIRGVQPQQIDRVVDVYLRGLRLWENAGRQAYNCSGGTRRKLSLAAAAIGRPRLLLLDEPSVGLDPLSRRFLWDTVHNTLQGSRGAILTTHSMEEADALCTRVAIMTYGYFKCIGTTQHLKNRYGGGYVLEMKVSDGADKSVVQEFVTSNFPDCTVKSDAVDRFVFRIPQQSVKSLADVFFLIEKVKQEMGIVMYSFNQMNLEQVFLNISAPNEESAIESSDPDTKDIQLVN